MKAEGLRIGNNVFNKNGKIVKIGISSFAKAADYKPIPITEEWLIRLGFENEDENRYWNNPMFLMKYDEGCIYLANQRHVNLFYLHQLQNLYFSLTGNELILGKDKD